MGTEVQQLRIHIIGIDCATQDKKIGLAHGHFANGAITVESADICARGSSAAKTVAAWITSGERPALIAIDAPLGWPAPMGALLQHEAGRFIKGDPNEFFRRATDRHIKTTIGKMPLDVGADRIARTAFKALSLLEEIRSITGETVPLAWSVDLESAVSAIEVYPAATLAVRSITTTGYKPPAARNERQLIVEHLERHEIHLANPAPVLANADVLDAVICLLAARDFLLGEAPPPDDIALARKEGWIWCRAGEH